MTIISFLSLLTLFVSFIFFSELLSAPAVTGGAGAGAAAGDGDLESMTRQPSLTSATWKQEEEAQDTVIMEDTGLVLLNLSIAEKINFQVLRVYGGPLHTVDPAPCGNSCFRRRELHV